MARLPVNQDFFKVWSPEMAYVLGFFCADGAMTINSRGSKYIDFDIADKELLIEIKKCLGSSHPIKERRRHNSLTYRLQIGSKEIFNDLLALGFTPKKTFRFTMPEVPEELFKHFIRGYFDGDGSVWSGLIHKERKTPTRTLRAVFTSGNRRFLEQLAHILNNRIAISGFFTNTGGAWQLVYSIKSSLSLYRFMYTDTDSQLYLNRKKVIFESFIINAAVV